jgi:outer membrane protein OmpA-like peptidoglycan-associated protein
MAPVRAATIHLAKVIPGTVPIWRNQNAGGEKEAYQFLKSVPLGADPIRKITLEINCDDAARVYINQRLVSGENRNGRIKDGYDDWYTFRSVSGFTYQRVYTYDVTDYFFTNVNNTILVEAISLAFDGGHSYISAKMVIEFDPLPVATRAAPAKTAPPAKPKPAAPAAKESGIPAPAPEKVVFEAGRDPQYESLRVGSVLELGNVYFKTNDYQLDSSSYQTLSALAAFMQRHPTLKIEVGGHTNLRPKEQFAAELSANRAQSVRRFLLEKGIAPGRVTAKGYGKSQPRIQALSKSADRENQRVEIKVMEK